MISLVAVLVRVVHVGPVVHVQIGTGTPAGAYQVHVAIPRDLALALARAIDNEIG